MNALEAFKYLYEQACLNKSQVFLSRDDARELLKAIEDLQGDVELAHTEADGANEEAERYQLEAETLAEEVEMLRELTDALKQDVQRARDLGGWARES